MLEGVYSLENVEQHVAQVQQCVEAAEWRFDKKPTSSRCTPDKGCIGVSFSILVDACCPCGVELSVAWIGRSELKFC